MESGSYVNMSLAVLRNFGIRIMDVGGGRYHVPAKQKYRPHPVTVEGDWSNAAFLEALNRLGGQIRIRGLDRLSPQGDKRFTELADALSAAGVRYFYSALHTHHGMYPLHRNPAFFRWRGPGGGRVLTFVGEHYHWGHVLGLCPHGTSSFMLSDDLLREIESGKRFTTDAETTEREEIDLAARRITRYLAGLEEYGWPLDFIPVFVSGVLS